jgi:hypothetical protein
LHFQTLVHMSYTIYVFVLDPCICMEMYFKVVRFVSILLDFNKNKMYIGVF